MGVCAPFITRLKYYGASNDYPQLHILPFTDKSVNFKKNKE